MTVGCLVDLEQPSSCRKDGYSTMVASSASSSAFGVEEIYGTAFVTGNVAKQFSRSFLFNCFCRTTNFQAIAPTFLNFLYFLDDSRSSVVTTRGRELATTRDRDSRKL